MDKHIFQASQSTRKLSIISLFSLVLGVACDPNAIPYDKNVEDIASIEPHDFFHLTLGRNVDDGLDSSIDALFNVDQSGDRTTVKFLTKDGEPLTRILPPGVALMTQHFVVLGFDPFAILGGVNEKHIFYKTLLIRRSDGRAFVVGSGAEFVPFRTPNPGNYGNVYETPSGSIYYMSRADAIVKIDVSEIIDEDSTTTNLPKAETVIRGASKWSRFSVSNQDAIVFRTSNNTQVPGLDDATFEPERRMILSPGSPPRITPMGKAYRFFASDGKIYSVLDGLWQIDDDGHLVSPVGSDDAPTPQRETNDITIVELDAPVNDDIRYKIVNTINNSGILAEDISWGTWFFAHDTVYILPLFSRWRDKHSLVAYRNGQFEVIPTPAQATPEVCFKRQDHEELLNLYSKSETSLSYSRAPRDLPSCEIEVEGRNHIGSEPITTRDGLFFFGYSTTSPTEHKSIYHISNDEILRTIPAPSDVSLVSIDKDTDGTILFYGVNSNVDTAKSGSSEEKFQVLQFRPDQKDMITLPEKPYDRRIFRNFFQSW